MSNSNLAARLQFQLLVEMRPQLKKTMAPYEEYFVNAIGKISSQMSITVPDTLTLLSSVMNLASTFAGASLGAEWGRERPGLTEEDILKSDEFTFRCIEATVSAVHEWVSKFDLTEDEREGIQVYAECGMEPVEARRAKDIAMPYIIGINFAGLMQDIMLGKKTRKLRVIKN